MSKIPKASLRSSRSVETSSILSFPVVGMGASAGGLAAFEAFFLAIPSPINMAFVLVQHLAPDHKSLLSDLLRRCTSMEVFEVVDGMPVHINCVYTIPPGSDMAIIDGRLHLLEPSQPHGHRMAVDFFFRSLAQDLREQAIGIVLSGNGCDGTQGARAIKAEGGTVLAQTPTTTEFDSMPKNAIASGLADFQLAPGEMPAQLLSLTGRNRLTTSSLDANGNELRKIFALLRTQTGHDFSQYKPNTILRRIERRMAFQQMESFNEYAKYCHNTPQEVESLFRDLLIGVTNFFRDPESFKALEESVLPGIFSSKPPGSVIRIWVAGCSTGEEAYSIAILFKEQMETLRQNHTLQIFATDVDAQAIAHARTGVFPASIAADISQERLTRFFTLEPGRSSYKITKGIRDLLVFSEQSVIKDPPFSKLDLISCRNLMIYLGGELQKKLIPLFHYALLPHGTLFLGTSETIGEFGDLFVAMDRKAKLYQRKIDIHGVQRLALGRILTPNPTYGADPQKMIETPIMQPKLPLRELTEQALLKLIRPSGALVNAQGDILYLHGRTGIYLEPPPGEMGVSNILKMARDGLRRELVTALHKATLTRSAVSSRGLRVQINGLYSSVNLTVSPVAIDASNSASALLYLVLLEEGAPGPVEPISVVSDRSSSPVECPIPTTGNCVHPDANLCVAALSKELLAKEEYLQSAKEELETSNEELKSSNEEMQSVNEELQSTNEELETSKEELQSVNEELATVNTELQTKVVDLSRANNDMNNLLAGTGIATIFVDHQLRILRYTPTASVIINLIHSDVGRPVGHLVSNLAGYDRLVADTRVVLDTLIPKEVDVQTTEGKWYTMRIQPYRTLENVIEGAVITFVDITEVAHAREALRKANDLLRLAAVVRDSSDAITVQDLEGRTLAWNPGATQLYGWSEAEALAMNVRQRIPPDLQQDDLARAMLLSQSAILEPYRSQRITKSGRVLEVLIISTALVNEAGKLYAISTTERATAFGIGGLTTPAL